MRNFQDTFEACNQSFISAFSICTTVPLKTNKQDAVISLSQFKELGVVFIYLSFQCYIITYIIFSEKKLSQASKRNQQRIGIKSFYSSTSYHFEYKKSCVSKFSIKMSIKRRKTRAGKVLFVYFNPNDRNVSIFAYVRTKL